MTLFVISMLIILQIRLQSLLGIGFGMKTTAWDVSWVRIDLFTISPLAVERPEQNGKWPVERGPQWITFIKTKFNGNWVLVDRTQHTSRSLIFPLSSTCSVLGVQHGVSDSSVIIILTLSSLVSHLSSSALYWPSGRSAAHHNTRTPGTSDAFRLVQSPPPNAELESKQSNVHI